MNHDGATAAVLDAGVTRRIAREATHAAKEDTRNGPAEAIGATLCMQDPLPEGRPRFYIEVTHTRAGECRVRSRALLFLLDETLPRHQLARSPRRRHGRPDRSRGC
jgi:hypothetical protein